MSNNKINQIQEKIATLKEKQATLSAQQQNLVADIKQAEADLTAEIERQKLEEARLSKEERQLRQQLKEKVTARLELAGQVDKAITNLVSNIKSFLDLAAEVESLACQVGKTSPALASEKAKFDIVDSIKEAANCLEIPNFFKHVPAVDRKSFLEKERIRLRVLE